MAILDLFIFFALLQPNVCEEYNLTELILYNLRLNVKTYLRHYLLFFYKEQLF